MSRHLSTITVQTQSGKMAVQSLFAELQHAYFTVTVQQSTIDQWRTHGGRTTFSARTANGDECVRLVPFIGLIDDFTGKPARVLPPSTDGGSEESLARESGEEVSSRWRLPVLVFCGKEDEGLSIKDEEYLGRPLERDEACVVLSEAWVVDSLSAGRLLRMADYAKHAGSHVRVDLPSLFFPSHFPPTYLAPVSYTRETPANLLTLPIDDSLRKMDVTRNAVSRGPVLQVLGSFKMPDETVPMDLRESVVRLSSSVSLGSGEKKYGCPTLPQPAADSGRIDSETSKKCEEFQAEDACSWLSEKRSFPWQTKLPGRMTSRDDTYDQSISQASLESYIRIKKKDYISRMQADLNIWIKQKIEKADSVDEARIDSELDESRENMTDCMEVRNDDGQENGSAITHTNATCTDPDTRPLELEANTLLKLLPPLKPSHLQHSEANINGDLLRSQYRNRTPNISYYPYLTPVSSDSSSKTARPPGPSNTKSLSNVQAQGSPHGIPLQARHKCSPQKKLIAFHSAGYGVGLMDFEACGDWVCVAKKRRLG